MKKEPRLKPEQSWGTIRFMEEGLESPVAERASGSRCGEGKGWVMLRGL